ncbi:MAG: dihydroorotate dehydrogenase electron transfer subunit [Candidatus Omnitrophica bacterium]|nr:dihydroorotate dehydrogenase electron transfer subunit [Candidatus Omnitrophota bacterium]
MDQKKIKSQKTAIISNERVAKGHFVMRLESQEIASGACPGQFVTVKAGRDATDPLLRIPLGIHKIGQKDFSLLYKVVGRGTRTLSRFVKDESVDVLGPLGNGFPLEGGPVPGKSKVVIVSGGHGVAPLFALAEYLRETRPQTKIKFLMGACTAEEVLCVKELEEMGISVGIATDDGTRGCRGFVTGLMEEEIKEKPARIFACGPRAMLAEVARIAEREKISASVSLDAYMACGIGACLGCALKTEEGYKLVCKDGPVFEAGEVLWKEAVQARQSCGCE